MVCLSQSLFTAHPFSISVSVAEAMGTKCWDIFRYTYLALFGVLILATVYRLFKTKLSDERSKLTRFFAIFNTVTLIIRCVDPLNFSNLLPIALFRLATSLCTAGVYGLATILLFSIADAYTKLRRITVPIWVYWLPALLLFIANAITTTMVPYGPSTRDAFTANYAVVLGYSTVIVVMITGVLGHTIILHRKAPSLITKSALRGVMIRLIPGWMIGFTVWVLQINGTIVAATSHFPHAHFFASDDPSPQDGQIGSCRVGSLLRAVLFEVVQAAATLLMLTFYKMDTPAPKMTYVHPSQVHSHQPKSPVASTVSSSPFPPISP